MWACLDKACRKHLRSNKIVPAFENRPDLCVILPFSNVEGQYFSLVSAPVFWHLKSPRRLTVDDQVWLSLHSPKEPWITPLIHLYRERRYQRKGSRGCAVLLENSESLYQPCRTSIARQKLGWRASESIKCRLLLLLGDQREVPWLGMKSSRDSNAERIKKKAKCVVSPHGNS